MKKTLALILVMVALFTSLTSCFLFRDDPADGGDGTSVEGLKFELLYNGTYAVSSCDLTYSGEVIIPATHNGKAVSEILPSAFEKCILITSVTVPESVARIGEGAFRGCYSLESISLPDRGQLIEKEAFLNTALYNDENNWSDGVLYIGSHLIKTSDISEGYTIKPGTKTIADEAFYGQPKLTSVSIPGGVVSIGNQAFSGCRELVDAVLPGTLKYIGNSAFTYCYKMAQSGIPDSVEYIGSSAFLTSSYYYNKSNFDSSGALYIGKHLLDFDNAGEKYTIADGTLTIAGGAFANCGDLKEVTIPEGVRSIGNYAFYDCENLSSVNIPSSVKYISDVALYGCGSLTSLHIPASVEYIAPMAFAYASKSLASITVDGENPNYYSEGNCLVGRHRGELILGSNNGVIPSGVAEICAFAFADCAGLTKVDIHGGVKSIANTAFKGCTSLTEINVAEGVKSIGAYAFDECTAVTKIILPDSIECIGTYAFGSTAFYADKSNWTDGVLYIGNQLICADPSFTFGEYTVREGTLTIANNAFAGCGGLTGVVIPDSVTNIGGGAFAACSALKSVNIPKNVKEIKEYTFDTSYGLEEILIPSNVESIGAYAFRGCKNLVSVTMEDGVKSIGEEAFSYCVKLEAINIAGTVEHIGARAFLECASLRSISVPKGVCIIEDGTFSKCYKLEELVLSEGLIAIGEGVINDCSIYDLVIPASVKHIDGKAFPLAPVRRLFYCGGEAEFAAIKPGKDAILIDGIKVYYYSEKAPSGKGDFWHYDKNGKAVIWE